LREGLYKVEFHTVHGTGSGVVYATAGKLRGGNSAFAFIGNYSGTPDEITRSRPNVITTIRRSSRYSEPT
jgi:hypothetical protein